jgi:Holliday junction resolvasome RuvABC endonuclease subunit
MKLLSTKQLLISTVSQIDIEIFSNLKQLQTKLIDIDKVVINYDPEKIAVENLYFKNLSVEFRKFVR